MPAVVPGKAESYWMDTTPETAWPTLVDSDVQVDVAVIGGGIAGLTAASELKKRGLTVAVLEAGRIAASVTGYTTAKLTALHTLKYAHIEKTFGADGARQYAESQQAAIEHVGSLVESESIECDFERQAAYTYTVDEAEIDTIRDEVAAATRAGLPATFVTDSSLPYEFAAAIRMEFQAQFHPRRYLLHVAAGIPGDGSHIFENSRVTDVSEGDTPMVKTEGGSVVAGHVIVATHYPVFDPSMLFSRLEPHRDVVVAAAVPTASAPPGMYISTEPNTRSVRTAPYRNGERLLIVTGEPWKPGHETDAQARYAALAQWTTERFGVSDFSYHWSTQDNSTTDGVPYIGRLPFGPENTYVATGFGGWGMSNGTLSGLLLADLVTGVDNPWASLYTPRRVKPVAEAKKFFQANVDVAKRFIGDRLKTHDDNVSELAPGEGAVMHVNGERTAVYRDDDGVLHSVSAVCTHLGCIVAFNNAEKSWDCPCHGSRFAPDGAVLQGPANEPLEVRRARTDGDGE